MNSSSEILHQSQNQMQNFWINRQQKSVKIISIHLISEIILAPSGGQSNNSYSHLWFKKENKKTKKQYSL